MGEKGLTLAAGIKRPSWTMVPHMGSPDSPRAVENTKESIRALQDLTTFQQLSGRASATFY